MPVGDWDALIAEASCIEKPIGPERLLALLLRRDNPFSNEDQAQEEEYRQALQADLNVVHQYRWSHHPLSKEDRDIWIDRLAWLLKTLDACHYQRPGSAMLVAILRTGSAFAFETRIWHGLPAKYFSDNLLASMAAFVGSTQCSFNLRGSSEPIWEREAVDNFLQADAAGDWPKIERAWQTIVPAIWPDGDLAEATACLCATEKGCRALALALDACQTILPIASVANVMTPDKIGQVVTHVISDRARFALVQSLAFKHPRNESLSDATLDNLVKLFRRVQQNDAEWQKWMRAFNRYPVRTRALQPAFGKSMAGSQQKAKAAYMEALDLSTNHGDCREAATTCLSEFCKAASLDERRAMWTLAYQRWQAWDFARNCTDTPLMWMAVSDLDFALIGYVVECLSDSELRTKLAALTTELTTVQDRWYSDRVAFESAWYSALSRWQIFTYAASVRAGQYEWEAPRKVLMPFDPSADRYCAMSLGTSLPYGREVR